MSSGAVATNARIWLMVAVRSPAGAALGRQQRAYHLDRAVSTFRRPTSSAGGGGPRRANGIGRIGFALAASCLSVGSVDFDYPHPGGLEVAGQAGPVRASTFDPDAVDGPESAQPPEQGLVAGKCCGELLDSQQAADAVQRGCHMRVQMVSTPPVTARLSTMVIAIPSPFALKGWHAPPGVGSVTLSL
jgi:hypothetical protein